MSSHKLVSDYLDHALQRWDNVFQKASGSREMVEDDKGEFVKFDDMDLYMFEGALLMQQMADKNDELLAALKELVFAETERLQGAETDSAYLAQQSAVATALTFARAAIAKAVQS